MMSSIIFILSMGILNALRGSGFWKEDDEQDRAPTLARMLLGRTTWMLTMAITIALFLLLKGAVHSIGALLIMPLLFLVLWGCFTPGWGKYFNCAFPNMDKINESEIKIIDWITTAIYKKPVTVFEFQLWCFIAMSLRGLLFYPVFLLLSLVADGALLCGLGMSLMGVIYWARRFTPELKAIRIAEFSNGCLISSLICASLIF